MILRPLTLTCALLLSGCAWFRPDPPEYPKVRQESGLVLRDLVVPESGSPVEPGDSVAIHFELWAGRSLVESSLATGQPLRFQVGKGMVPAGLDQGVLGMRLFGRRRIVIPPELGYGSQGKAPLIPPDATLSIDVELMEHAPRSTSTPGD